MDGMSNYPNANAAMMQMTSYGNIQAQAVPQTNSATEMTPQRKAVFERLKKRMNVYRKRQNETIPRFDQTFSGICEQQSVETNLLQKKFLESKAKRVAKKADKKQSDVPNNVTVTKSQKRPAPDDLENDPDLHQPQKIPNQQQQQQQGQQSMDNMKFQVEIVQQLEFTTNVANMQPQQISTNVTVKATANGSLKYESQDMKAKEMPKMQQQQQQIMPPHQDILQDFKQEPDNEFADLDFGGIANFMANDENELKKLFSNISEVFDQTDLFDDTKHIKQEPMKVQPMPHLLNNQPCQMTNQFNQYVMQDQRPMMQQIPQQQQQQQHRIYQQPMQHVPDITPAAQTLKNMAQQHQVKSSMAMNYMRPQQMNIPQQQQQQPILNNRVSYQQPQQQQQQYEYTQQQFHKQQMQLPFPPEMIKQEMMMPQSMMTHQQPIHGSYQNFQAPQFIQQQPPQPQRSFQQQQQQQQNAMNIHMKQTQMMNIQQGGGGNLQMQGGQHMGISMNDGNFSMQQQQNMYFNAHHGHQGYGAMGMQKGRVGQGGGQQQSHHQNPHGMSEGPTNTYNMMQSQSMSFTQ